YARDRETFGLSAIHGQERMALSAGASTDGGFLAPPSFAAEIFSARAAVAVVRPNARAIPADSDHLTVARTQHNADDPDVYRSAFVGGWYGETTSHNFDDNVTFEGVNIPIRKLRVGTKVS